MPRRLDICFLWDEISVGERFPMNAIVLVLGVMALTAVGLTIYGAVVPRRSLPIALVALAVLGVGSLGAWYAWMETQSIPWTVGYLTMAAIALIAFVRQLMPGSMAR